MSNQKANLLYNFDVDEVSLVPKGANKKKFAITKKEAQVPQELDHEQILKNVELKREDAETQINEVFKEDEIDSKGMTALSSAMALLQGVRELLPEGMNIRISDDSDKYDGVSLSIRKEDEPILPEDGKVMGSAKKKKKKKPSMNLGETEMKKSEDLLDFIQKAEGLEDNQRESLTQIIKESAMSDQDTIKKAEAESEKIQKENTDLKAENTAFKDRIEKLEKSEKASRVEKDVASFPSLEKEKVEKALNDAIEISDDHYEMIKKSLISAEEIAKSAQANIIKELGSDAEGGAVDPVQAKADEIKKADPSLTNEQAYDRALTENPDLYEQS